MPKYTKIEQPTREGEESKCAYCGIMLIGRLTDYGGSFADYIQWQTVDERKAHYLKVGGCKGQPNEVPNTSSNQVEANIQPMPKLNSIDEDKVIKSTRLLCEIRNQVTETTKNYVVAPHPGMIWEMTALIYKQYFTKTSLGGDGFDD